MPRIEKAGYKKYWELKQLVGHNSDNTRRAVEGFRDMTTGKFHAPKEGWNGAPPELPFGERNPIISDKYKRNYDAIFRRGKR